ncbi:MAG: (Fe-S)-binding protein [Bacteroidales bacterium]|jgi:Fe-S oxidoreductase|nr:(Fe-S)-binding protein [Bacteroidales bacterium]
MNSQIFHPFVLPFVLGMAFVLTYCVVGLLRVIGQLPKDDRKKFWRSLVTPKTAWANIRDLVGDCLFHVKIWKRNPVLGYMHTAIAFGWFMIIVIGHVMLFTLKPLEGIELQGIERTLPNFYYPIFFKYFAEETPIFAILMDFFLLMIISGILIAVVKKIHSKIVGVKRIMHFGFADNLIRFALWTIFPFRLIAEKTNIMAFWWLYSIDLMVFMFMLPFTRYMHIPTEALFILLRHAGLKPREPRKGYALAQIYSCPSCGLCIDACPMSVNDKNSGNTSAYFMKRLRNGDREEAQRIAETCMQCGKCVAVCPVSIESCDIKMSQREAVPYTINSDHSYLDNVEPETKGNAKVLYFAGCMTQLTPKIMRAMKQIMEAADEKYAFLDKDGGVCCGRPMLLSGKTAEAQAMMAKNTELIKQSGAKRLVLSCPICYKVFKEEYQLEDIEILHHSQYIDELIKRGKLKVDKNDLNYVYHDPCELGRAFGVYDEPREVIENIGHLRKAKSEKELSICCGGSLGSFNLTQQERDEITTNSVNDLIFNNPDEIVTACPLCLKTFARKSPVAVKDIAEVVANQLK